MAKEVFIHQALNFGDYVQTLHYTSRNDFSKIIDIEGEDNLKAAYEKGKGVLCLMSHIGSWEFSAILPPVMGYNTTALSRPMPNPRIDKLIVGARQKRGMKNIGRGKAYPHLIEALTKGDCLIIMVDQDTQAPGVFVDFLGKRAFTPVGAARLALDTKSPVVPMFMIRQPNNRHLFKILPPLELIDTGNRERDLYENTRIYTGVISRFIHEHPTQWVWMHERWKTTPEDYQRFLEKKQKLKKMQ
jgi:KDO2-lipid IV(A) lauroyltransferase